MHLRSWAQNPPKTLEETQREINEAIQRERLEMLRRTVLSGIDPDRNAPYLAADDYEAAVGYLSERRPLTQLEGRAFYRHLEILRNLDEEFGPLAA